MPRVAAEEAVLDRAVSKWVLDLTLHPGQREVWESPARFKVVAAGRRFGKTMLAAAKAIEVAASKPDAVVTWVSSSHAQSRIGFRMVARALPARSRELNKTLGEIYLSTGGRMIFGSTERWDNLRGEGNDLVVVDEAAFCPSEVWFSVLRASLADKKGSALLIGTFNGENWFYDLWRNAMNPANTEWAAFKFITADNPYIDDAEIEEFRLNNPKEVFEQEMMSSPLAYSGAVFPGELLEQAWENGKGFQIPGVVEAWVNNRLMMVEPQTPEGLARKRSREWMTPAPIKELQDVAHRELIRPVTSAGLDWGQNECALEIAYETSDGRLAWVDEHIWQRIELGARMDDISRICTEWNIEMIYADAAGATENAALAAHFEQAGIPTLIQPVPFATYKRVGILARKWYLEHANEAISAACPQLFIDSKSYAWDKKSGAGDEKPMKGHDHTVDAATCVYAARSDMIGQVEED